MQPPPTSDPAAAAARVVGAATRLLDRIAGAVEVVRAMDRKTGPITRAAKAEYRRQASGLAVAGRRARTDDRTLSALLRQGRAAARPLQILWAVLCAHLAPLPPTSRLAAVGDYQPPWQPSHPSQRVHPLAPRPPTSAGRRIVAA